MNARIKGNLAFGLVQRARGSAKALIDGVTVIPCAINTAAFTSYLYLKRIWSKRAFVIEDIQRFGSNLQGAFRFMYFKRYGRKVTIYRKLSWAIFKYTIRGIFHSHKLRRQNAEAIAVTLDRTLLAAARCGYIFIHIHFQGTFLSLSKMIGLPLVLIMPAWTSTLPPEISSS